MSAVFLMLLFLDLHKFVSTGYCSCIWTFSTFNRGKKAD